MISGFPQTVLFQFDILLVTATTKALIEGFLFNLTAMRNKECVFIMHHNNIP